MPLLVGDRLVQLDVNEFIMSGDCDSLVDDVGSSLCSGPLQQVLSRALYFLLQHQYIFSSSLPGRLRKVMRGSGMGLARSGEVADVGLAGRAGRRAVRQLTAYMIQWYLRFKDDIL
eukprot:3021035-Pyramimonas_sp.AAC.1